VAWWLLLHTRSRRPDDAVFWKGAKWLRGLEFWQPIDLFWNRLDITTKLISEGRTVRLRFLLS